MIEGLIYEFDLSLERDTKANELRNPHVRPMKKKPNTMNIFRRACYASVAGSSGYMDLFEIIEVSFVVRQHIYTKAQSSVNASEKLIICIGSNRGQEWKEMKLSEYVYVLVDPEVRPHALPKDITVVEYNHSLNLSMQVERITKARGAFVLYYRGTFKQFMSFMPTTRYILTKNVPIVCSFSLAHCFEDVLRLRQLGMRIYACGYSHSMIPNENDTFGIDPTVFVNLGGKVKARFGETEWFLPNSPECEVLFRRDLQLPIYCI